MSKEKVYYEVESCENNCERVNELEQQNKELKALLCQRCNYFGACELDEIPCAVLNYK